jgi:hypothetical protein
MIEIGLISRAKKLLNPNHCVIDDPIYQLHYKFTTLSLITISFMITARQHIGDPITSQYVGCGSGSGDDSTNQTMASIEMRKYQIYYYWTHFGLLVEAFFFFIPHYIWKSNEKTLIKSLVQDLNHPILEKETRDKNLKQLVDYMVQHFHQHNRLFAIFICTEVLNLVNVLVQLIVMYQYLGNPLKNCQQNCFVPINDVIEFVYFLVWSWFHFLVLFTVLALIYRLCTIISTRARILTLSSRYFESRIIVSVVK